MALTLPKIVYPTGGGATLTFSLPPRRVPYKSYAAVRHDNIATSGVLETIHERTDEFLELELEYVTAGSYVSGWDSFMQYALQGGAFDYYPDSTSGTNTTYTLVDTNWRANWKQLGMYSFSVKFRKRVAWP